MEVASKIVSRSVSLSADLWAQLDRIAVEKYTGNRTAYLRQLIMQDINGLSVGTPQSAFTVEDLAEFRRSEAALLRAEILAREYMWSEEAEKPKVGRRLCEYILTATRRRSVEYPEPTAQEWRAAEAAPEADQLAKG